MKAFIEALSLFIENVCNRYVEYKARPTHTYVTVMDELDTKTLPKREYHPASEDRCLSW